MKKTSFFLIVLLLTACSSSDNGTSNLEVKNVAKEEDYIYTSYLDGVDTSTALQANISADYAIDISNVSELKHFVSNVFIGTVDSIDGCSSTVATGEFDPTPSTYGNITIIDHLSGNVSSDKIKFTRGGGNLTIAEYEKNAPQDLIDNDNRHREEAGLANVDKETTYITFFYDDDIKIEAGKTYVFFATYVAETDRYLIDGVQYGTRQIVHSSTNKEIFRSMPARETLSIKNNVTLEYESLQSFIDTYFKQ